MSRYQTVYLKSVLILNSILMFKKIMFLFGLFIQLECEHSWVGWVFSSSFANDPNMTHDCDKSIHL